MTLAYPTTIASRRRSSSYLRQLDWVVVGAASAVVAPLPSMHKISTPAAREEVRRTRTVTVSPGAGVATTDAPGGRVTATVGWEWTGGERG